MGDAPASLKYDWWGAVAKLRYGEPRYRFADLERALAVAEWFIPTWADFAEFAKMQPAHLLRNDPTDEIGRGLAWRWAPNMDVCCFPRERHLVAETWASDNTATLFIYYFHPDGRVTHIFERRRQEIIAARMELDARPPEHVARNRRFAAEHGLLPKPAP
jgi:hypothetical protein